jgi:hypothetical protein
MKTETDALVAAFERDNADLVAPTERLLGRLVGLKSLHARFMNTLSMLEHIGSHKIMATQHGVGIDQPTLKHLADETRHALFFKRHADQEAGRDLAYDDPDLVAPAAARRYFRRLEAEVVRMLPANAERRAGYLMMSMIVEFRAIWGYRLYHAVLARAGHRVSLKGLLAEEGGHLADMAKRLDGLAAFDPARIAALRTAEGQLYRRLLDAFDGAVGAA